MSHPPELSDPSAVKPWRGFLAVFLAVFCVILAGTALVTFMMPETFVGVARAKAASAEAAATFESEPVLNQVIGQLELRRAFARRYGQADLLPVTRCVEILRRSVQVRWDKSSGLAEIRGYSHNPEEAAQFANAVVRAGASSMAGASSAGSGPSDVVEWATPATRPVRPNKPLNLTLGALVGAFLGALSGGIGARLAVLHRARLLDKAT